MSGETYKGSPYDQDHYYDSYGNYHPAVAAQDSAKHLYEKLFSLLSAQAAKLEGSSMAEGLNLAKSLLAKFKNAGNTYPWAKLPSSPDIHTQLFIKKLNEFLTGTEPMVSNAPALTDGHTKAVQEIYLKVSDLINKGGEVTLELAETAKSLFGSLGNKTYPWPKLPLVGNHYVDLYIAAINVKLTGYKTPKAVVNPEPPTAPAPSTEKLAPPPLEFVRKNAKGYPAVFIAENQNLPYGEHIFGFDVTLKIHPFGTNDARLVEIEARVGFGGSLSCGRSVSFFLKPTDSLHASIDSYRDLAIPAARKLAADTTADVLESLALMPKLKFKGKYTVVT